MTSGDVVLSLLLIIPQLFAVLLYIPCISLLSLDIIVMDNYRMNELLCNMKHHWHVESNGTSGTNNVKIP